MQIVILTEKLSCGNFLTKKLPWLFYLPGEWKGITKMKKILSLMIAISMLLSMVITPAYAEETPVWEQSIHNIAEKYAADGVLEDANMLWFLPDMMAYQELFPDSENIVSAEEKQACLSKIIDDVKETNAPGTLAKAIIALRSMGYDARHIVTEDLGEIDIVSRLTALVDENDSSVTIVWTLPYVLIALQQGEDYATEEQIEFLTNLLVEKKLEWQDMMWGPDTAAPVIFALAPYYETNDAVKTAIDETIPMITDQQDDTGIIGNAASTGLAIAALSGIGINSEEIVKNENTLIDGLMTQASENLDGFEPMSNSFSTEQGFRGLISHAFLKNNLAKRVYDFIGYPMNTAYEVSKTTCSVTFQTTPIDADVVIENVTPVEPGKYELSEGEYTYTVSKSGYRTNQGAVSITADDITNGEKIITIVLNRKSSGGSSAPRKLSVTVDVMVHGDECNNQYTYKNNASEFDTLASVRVSLNKGETVYDALAKALEKEDIDHAEENGYVSEIGGYSEFDHGNRSGWMFTVDGKHKNTGCRETKLTKDSIVLWYYTDDYTKERGSQEENEDSSKVDTETRFGLYSKNEDITYKEIINKGKTFADIANCAGKAEIEALAERGIINGKTEENYDPDATMTRAEFATIVVNALGLPKKDGIKFADVNDEEWYAPYIKTAYHYGIVKGVSLNQFNPQGTITTEEATAMVERAAKLGGIKTDMDILTAKNTLEKFEDFNSISVWAITSLGYCVKDGILDSEASAIRPKENVTREKIAVMIYRMLGKAKLI